jgi:hypothetical protein
MKNYETIAYVGPNIMFGPDFWATKLPYAWLSLRLDGSLHVTKWGFALRWKGKINCLFLSGTPFYKHAKHKKVDKNIGINVKKGD